MERRKQAMSQQAAAARTPGATRAGEGEYVFDLAKVNHILGGPDYSTANGACVEGDRMIVGLMQMPAGTGAEPHSHPNEQWIYILQGTFRGKIGDKEIEASPARWSMFPPMSCITGEQHPTPTSCSSPARTPPTACMESRRRDRRRLRAGTTVLVPQEATTSRG
jgi:hypothetical protein